MNRNVCSCLKKQNTTPINEELIKYPNSCCYKTIKYKLEISPSIYPLESYMLQQKLNFNFHLFFQEDLSDKRDVAKNQGQKHYSQ